LGWSLSLHKVAPKQKGPILRALSQLWQGKRHSGDFFSKVNLLEIELWLTMTELVGPATNESVFIRFCVSSPALTEQK